MRDGSVFLRWARLKRTVKWRENPVPQQKAAGDAFQSQADGVFDPAVLPAVESISDRTSISAFLRNGVPDDLARAALRRAWTADPAIRDFIGIADNQWNFNDPDAMIGFGPLESTASDLVAYLQKGMRQVPDSIGDPPTPDWLMFEPKVLPTSSPIGPSGSITWSVPIDGPKVADEPCRAPPPPALANEIKSARTAQRHGSALPR